MKIFNKKAYTLSETLIVLAIIAFIASIVTETILTHTPKRSVFMLKKTYFALSQALEEVSNNSFFYRNINPDVPRLAGTHIDTTTGNTVRGNINVNMADDVRSILNLPAGTVLNENNWLCYTVANTIKLKSSNCNACTNAAPGDLSQNFITEDGTGVYGLCGAFPNTIGNAFASKDIYLLIDAPKRSALGINTITTEARRRGRSKDTFAFWLRLTPEGTLAPVPDNINGPRIEEEILMDSSVNH